MITPLVSMNYIKTRNMLYNKNDYTASIANVIAAAK